MELFFLLSGVGVWYALRFRSVGEFIRDRAKRLLIPLYTVGLFILNPPQFYFDILANEDFRGTFMESLPRYFGRWGFHTESPHGLVPVPSPMHMWFLQYLFLISLMALPLLLYLRSERGQRWIGRLAGWSNRRGGIFLLFIPVATVLTFSNAGEGTTYTWADSLWYASFFVFGYVIAADKRFTDSIKRHGRICLILWIVIDVLWGNGIFPSIFGSDPVRESSWFAVVFVLSLGAKYLKDNNKVLAYSGEAVLPFYLLHHTVIVLVGWFVIRWNMPSRPKFLIITVISFPSILLSYELLVKRVNIMRFFFGMRPRKKPSS